MNSNNPPISYVRIPEQKLKEYLAQADQIIALKQELAQAQTQINALLSLHAKQPSLAESLSPTPPRNSELSKPVDRSQSASAQNGPVPTASGTPAPPAPLQSVVSAFDPAISDPLVLPRERILPQGGIEPQKRTAVPYWEIYKGTIDYIKSQLAPTGYAPPIPYLLNERSISVIMNAIELGMTRYSAAALVGITRANMEKYRSHYNKDQEPYVTFFALMEMAEARTEADLVARWRAHTHGSWQAAEAFMKRRFAATWGDRSGTKDLSAQDLAALSVEELSKIAGIDLNDLILEALSTEEGQYDATPYTDD